MVFRVNGQAKRLQLLCGVPCQRPSETITAVVWCSVSTAKRNDYICCVVFRVNGQAKRLQLLSGVPCQRPSETITSAVRCSVLRTMGNCYCCCSCLFCLLSFRSFSSLSRLCRNFRRFSLSAVTSSLPTTHNKLSIIMYAKQRMTEKTNVQTVDFIQSLCLLIRASFHPSIGVIVQ